ncbi:MAG: sodium:calcium symporter [Ignavibacterium sp.]|uniref:sodium-dependent transporter n=1 Tax=Ignavibacterium sp. TaxID=2651167 RepID=UPI0021DCF861|nr:sodium-dependent transporter [Ignavibacterium sp.]BDQ02352.1 MAG: sodium:calcium symporter [Ignavibacterium sp.]GIV45920.1 MAG: sodium:calcium symporter [Ignavibacterium sp.]
MANSGEREQWGTRIGLILAVAGNAVGLGNFLRFPVQAAQNGGGAFMIPYFIFFILLGIPLMWIEWGIGRHGGKYRHGSAPGMFDVLWKHKLAKYLGSFGLFISLTILIYYTYIESWTLGFSIFSILGFFSNETVQTMPNFLSSYQGVTESSTFSSIWTAYLLMLFTFCLNFYILYRGIAQGIEKLAKIAMPLLFIFAIILVVRVITLGTPDPSLPDNSVENGFAFIWNPDFNQLGNPIIWLAAAGQIFFTLSVGMGTIHAYASYLKPKDDIALSALTTASTNEFAEVVLGASIAIPVAVAFFGLDMTKAIAQGGAFNLGFVAMPAIFGSAHLPLGEIFGFLWFLLLFFAGITSSVAMGQPIVAFLEDEFGMDRRKAVLTLAAVVLISVQFVVFFLKYGFLDEMDYWAGTFGLVVFALMETILFMWVFGADKAWKEMNDGGDIKIPRIFYYIMKYITPLILAGIMVWWFVQNALPTLLLKNVAPENVPYIWGSRVLMLILLGGIMWLVKKAWNNRKEIF